MVKCIGLIISLFIGLSNGRSQSNKNDLRLTISVLPLIGSADGFDSDFNGLVLNPSIGYFISEKTAIDLNFTFSTYNNLIIRGVYSYYNSFAFTPTLRNNFVNKEKLRIFAEIGFGLGTIKYDADDRNFRTIQHEELSGGISILNMGIGANYFFNEKFGVELIVPYISTRNITSENTNILYSGVGPTIGLTYKLK